MTQAIFCNAFGILGNITGLLLFLAPSYGLPFVSKNNMQICILNGTGAVIETIYVFIFIIYASKKEKGKTLGLLTAFAAVALVSLFALHDKKRKYLCGIAAAIFSIIMYASPLSIMTLVIKTKSVEYMPFLLSLFVFLCGTSWCLFGLLGEDPFVYVPNGFGCFLGLMQLILYAIYCGNKCQNKKATAEASLEMGHGNGKRGEAI